MSLEDRLYPLLSLYGHLPQGLKSALGFAYRQLPRQWRWGARYDEFDGLTQIAESASLQQIQEYQLRHLRAVLIQAGNYCPFYQKAFARAG